MTRALRAVRLALAFLTVLPLRFRDGEIHDADLAASRLAYPLVGALIGLVLLGLSSALARLAAAPGPSAFLLILSLVLLTGGLHLDGLADTFDALFLPGGPERRLAVLKDPHVGSFGVVAIVLALLGKFAALSTLEASARGLALLAATFMSRTAVLVAAGSARYARPEGTGRFLIDATRPLDAAISSCLILAVCPLLQGWPGLAAGATTLIVAWSLARVATRQLGGLTGDLCGAVVELSELSSLLALGAITPG
jgi:adenosylcobinamide-GDP ribazoletransferase